MPTVATLAALDRAAADLEVTDLPLDIEPSAREAAQQSLADSGMLLLGEVHGVSQNPLVIRALLHALNISQLALEWPAELSPLIDAYRQIRIRYGVGHFYNLEPRRFPPDPRVRRGLFRLGLRRGSLLLDLPGPSEAIVPHRPCREVPAPA